MRAIVYTAPGELELLEVEDPTPAEGEVLVGVERVGICGSELEGVATRSPFRVPPLIMGHELVGTRLDTGERVAVNPLLSCGRCDLCLAGRANLCRERQLVGVHRAGGFAERVTVPEPALHPLGDHISASAGALAEPFANAIHAWRLGNAGPGSRVAVIGAGTVGLTILTVALRYGASPVQVADRSSDRREAAERVGASTVAAELEGEFDVVFDAVGAAATRSAAMRVLAPGGTVVWIGLHDEAPGFDGRAAVRREQRVQGSFAYTDADFRAAIDMLPAIDSSWTTETTLEAGVALFFELMDGRTDLVKVQMTP
jgi:2-desacetyl-2-hydroxyethyl bacteriochlorophyllide A dehydrogenase